MALQHTVLSLFGSDLWFRTFEAQCKDAAPGVDTERMTLLNLASEFRRLAAYARSDEAVQVFLEANVAGNLGFKGTARVAQRVLSMYVPAVALGCLGGPETLAQGLGFYDIFEHELDGLRSHLAEPEILMMRMLVFNQLTTPVLLALAEKAGGGEGWPEIEQRRMSECWRKWGLFSSREYRSVLERVPTYSGRVDGGRQTRWYSNWVLYQPVNDAGTNPMNWGKGNTNQPLFQCAGAMSRDYEFLSRAYDDPAVQRRMAAWNSADFLAKGAAGGEGSLPWFFGSTAVLRERDLAGGSRPLPLRARALLQIYDSWQRDLRAAGKTWDFTPHRARVMAPTDGFWLDLKGVFAPKTPDGIRELGDVLGYLMGRRLERLADYAEQMDRNGRNARRAQDVMNLCIQEGLVPSPRSGKASGQYANRSFWGSIIGKGQSHLSPYELPKIIRQLGRVAFERQLLAELEAVCPEASAGRIAALKDAIWGELEYAESVGMTGWSSCRVEPLFRDAALSVAMKQGGSLGFGLEQAFCLAYRVNFGSSSGGFSDFTKAYFERVESLARQGRFDPGAFLSEGAGVCVSAIAQWRKLLDAGTRDSATRALVLKAFESPFGLGADGSPEMLGTSVGKPGFWARAFDIEGLKRCFVERNGGFYFDGDLGDGLKNFARPEFSLWLDNIFETVRLIRAPLPDFELKLGDLDSRSSKFFQTAIHGLSPILDELSGKVLNGVTLPDLFGKLYRVTDNVASFQTFSHGEAFENAYRAAVGRLVMQMQSFDLGRFDFSFENRVSTPGHSGEKFVRWLLKLPAAGAIFYAGLAEGKNVPALFAQEFMLAPGAPESVYRKYHAAGLLLDANKQGFLNLDARLVDDLVYVRSRASTYLGALAFMRKQRTSGGGHRFSGPDGNLRSDLNENFSRIGDQVSALSGCIGEQAVTHGLRKAFERRVSGAFIQDASREAGRSIGIQDPTTAAVKAARRYSVVFELANSLDDMMQALPAAFEDMALKAGQGRDNAGVSSEFLHGEKEIF